MVQIIFLEQFFYISIRNIIQKNVAELVVRVFSGIRRIP